MTTAYYNEIDPFCCEWIQNLMDAGLITKGRIDDRPIQEVQPDDVAGYDRVHWFAGLAGWEVALGLAGWPDRPVWSGSCPCQPFSVAGRGEGADDERHLWPELFRLIDACGPRVVLGEQVCGSDVVGKANCKHVGDSEESPVWFDGICADLARAHYACTAFDLPAACVDSPNIRQRLWWVAVSCRSECGGWTEPGREHGGTLHASDRCGIDRMADSRQQSSRIDGTGESVVASPESSERWTESLGESGRRCGTDPGRLGDTDGAREDVHAATSRSRDSIGEPSSINRLEHAESNGRIERRPEPSGGSVASGCGDIGLGDSEHSGLCGRQSVGAGASSAMPSSPFGDYRIIPCRDGKSRRISAQPGDEPLAYGVPTSLRPLVTVLEGMGLSPKDVKRFKRAAGKILANARRNRVGRLRGYGNAINPSVAAEFIKAFLEAERL